MRRSSSTRSKCRGGAPTGHLQKIAVGDTVLMRKKTIGTLVNDALWPGRRLYLFSTGTGIAPFASLIRDPKTNDEFKEIILTYTCRALDELKYGQQLAAACLEGPLIGTRAQGRLRHFTSVTRVAYSFTGRITGLMASGKLFDDLNATPIWPATDRAMTCGAMTTLNDTNSTLKGFGPIEGANSNPATFVVQRALVD